MKKNLFKLAVFWGIFSIAAYAHALAITPTTGTLDYSRFVGNDTSQPAIDAIIYGIMDSSAIELFKQNVGGGESGPLAGSYTATFSNTASDPSNATIVYDGGDFVGPPAYLLVKDGNQTPAWYLFALSILDPSWNGTETLELSVFWPNQGAISHVTLYGVQAVPEPGTMLLLGSGLVGLAGWGRKKFQK